jgi:GH18 family chitinase
VPGVPPSDTPGPTAWNAVYYDSPRSLTPKLRLADERGLAGAGFWAIGYERGLPGYTELIATFASGTLPQP